MKWGNDTAGTVLYRPEIDGLRGVAVLAVALYHAQFDFLPGGYIGVDVFFVISGYLITAIVIADLEGNRFSFAHFFERRARRLLPALFFYTAAAALTAWFVLGPPALEEFGRHLVGANLFSANIVYWLDANYFATKSEHLPLIHTWSLAVEQQFYIIYPALLFIVYRFGTTASISVLLVTAGLSLAAAHHLSSLSTSRDAAFYLLPTRAWELLAGSLMALWHTNTNIECKRRGSVLLSFVGLLGIVLAAFVFDATTHHPGALTLVPVIASCLVIGFAQRSTPVGRFLASAPLVWTGLVSYSFYLAHQPILAFARITVARPLSKPEAAGLLILSLAAAVVTWRWVEQPFRRRWPTSRRLAVLWSAGGASSLVLVGAVLVASHGFPARMDARVADRLAELERAGAGRDAGIRLGRCHWNKDVAPDLEAFLTRWNCLPDNKSNPRILVIGDSISADKAWMLREAGFAVGNIGGAGCPLVPPVNADEPCWKILKMAQDIVRSGAVDGIVLGQNWYDPVATATVDAVAGVWLQYGVPLLVFSGMPIYQDFKNQVIKHSKDGSPLERITFDSARYEAQLASLAAFRRWGIEVIDSRALLCGGKRQCGAFSHGVPLVQDPTHLAPAGARAMATRLAGDPTWSKWYRQLGP